MSKKKKRKMLPSFTIARLKKVLIQGKYVQLSDVKGLFNVNKVQENIILSQIMRSFFRGKLNLFHLPEVSELCRFPVEVTIDGKKKCGPEIITRELLRRRLIPNMIGKKRCLKKSELFDDNLNLIDGDDDLYKELQNEPWEFFSRILNRLKRKYCALATKATNIEISDQPLNALYKKFGKSLCKHNHIAHPNDVIKQLGGNSFFLLLLLSSLCISYHDLVKILGKDIVGIFSEKILGGIRNSLNAYDSKHNEDLVKCGYDLDNAFIFDDYIALKSKNPSQSDAQICIELKKGRQGTTIPSVDRIRRIIHEEKHRRIQNAFYICPKDELKENFIKKLSQKLFTTPKHVEKIFEETRLESKIDGIDF